ncbi:MAG: PAC2 family protein [candidate division WOR-3 bacterium]
MGVRIYREPSLRNPVLLCGWPGIGKIGLVAIDTLREQLKAEEFGEIEAWDFFYPNEVSIKDGILRNLNFPRNKFYYKSTQECDIIFFIADEQPSEEEGGYGHGVKAYHLASMILEVGTKYGIKRVYTSGAAVAQIHHTSRPRVWAVPNTPALIGEIRTYDNTILMSDIEGRQGQGTITGMNGLMLGVARTFGVDGICLMGEIPYYLQWFPFPWPKGSRAVLQVLTKILSIEIDLSIFDRYIEQIDKNVEQILNAFLESLPEEMREKFIESFERLKKNQASIRPISEEEVKWFKEHSDEFFRDFFKKEPGD